MTEVYVCNVPSNHKNYSHLTNYHLDAEYRQKIIMKATENNKKLVELKRYNHYKRLTEDPEYLKEQMSKGLRLRKVPEEFQEILKELTKK
jgi:hypothetical protein